MVRFDSVLFCIDALNEGIHVENVAGVILLRPTISPIIYKQQIGRALSASKTTVPVIFDIVNNIDDHSSAYKSENTKSYNIPWIYSCLHERVL